jgi:hypothetical protein
MKILVLIFFLLAGCQQDTQVSDFIVVNKSVDYVVQEDGAIRLENELKKENTQWADEPQRVCAKMIYNEDTNQFEITSCNQ